MPKSPTPIKDLRKLIAARKGYVPDKMPVEATEKRAQWLEVARGIIGP